MRAERLGIFAIKNTSTHVITTDTLKLEILAPSELLPFGLVACSRNPESKEGVIGRIALDLVCLVWRWQVPPAFGSRCHDLETRDLHFMHSLACMKTREPGLGVCLV